MKNKNLGLLAASTAALLSAKGAFAMDVATVKDKDGKVYFCANAKCAGNSECMGAGNATCGSQNKCGNTEQKMLVGWVSAPTKEVCEKDGMGKWVAFKKEHGVKDGNVAPLGKAKKSAAPKN